MAWLSFEFLKDIYELAGAFDSIFCVKNFNGSLSLEFKKKIFLKLI